MTSATQAWSARIRDHDTQSLKAAGDKAKDDRWSGIAGAFRADPRRTDDPLVNLLLGWVTPESTVLDVGGGAGRYALPLALHCRHVTVVEPSPAMVEQLNAAAAEAGITNISAVPEKWEEAKVKPADVVLCANVVYGVADIEPWVRKLDASARGRVAIVAWMDAPSSVFSPVWRAVFGEERIELPALPELLPVLWEMGIFPNVHMLPAGEPRYVPNVEAAIGFARHMLYVDPGTDADDRLQAAAKELAIETPQGVTLRGGTPRPPGVIWWDAGG